MHRVRASMLRCLCMLLALVDVAGDITGVVHVIMDCVGCAGIINHIHHLISPRRLEQIHTLTASLSATLVTLVAPACTEDRLFLNILVCLPSVFDDFFLVKVKQSGTSVTYRLEIP